MNIKTFVLSFFTIIVLNIFMVNKLYAFSTGEIGPSMVMPDFQVYVNGVNVDKKNKIIEIHTNKPVFFGYAESDVLLKFRLQSSSLKIPIDTKTTTNTNGYWVLTLRKPLPVGTYKFYYSVDDGQGLKSHLSQVATFIVPIAQVNYSGAIIAPQPSLIKPNFLTVTVFIFGFVAMLIYIYRIVKIHRYIIE